MKNKGRQFENKVVKSINSGAFWFSKGDLKFEDNCIEVKYTEKGSFRITNKLLDKLWTDSLDVNKNPILTIGIRKNEKEYYRLDCHLSKERG